MVENILKSCTISTTSMFLSIGHFFALLFSRKNNSITKTAQDGGDTANNNFQDSLRKQNDDLIAEYKKTLELEQEANKRKLKQEHDMALASSFFSFLTATSYLKVMKKQNKLFLCTYELFLIICCFFIHLVAWPISSRYSHLTLSCIMLENGQTLSLNGL